MTFFGFRGGVHPPENKILELKRLKYYIGKYTNFNLFLLTK